MTGATWFVADLHFGHEKVSALRGFSHPDHHDAAIARQWLKQVKDGDIIHVLGDISGGSRTGEREALEFLATLPGRKRLVSGNHDSVSGIHRTLSPHIMEFHNVFERVNDFARVRAEGRQVLLSHFPYEADHMDAPRHMQFRLPNLGLPLIHGHTHSTTRAVGNEMCVSWEAWGRLVGQGDLTSWLAAIAPEVSDDDE